MTQVSLPDEVRAACAWVAARARSVHLDEAPIPAYAEDLRAGAVEEGADAKGTGEPDPAAAAGAEAAAAFAICMNAVNFGSGWWPTIRKRPGLSGYATMEAGVRERFDANGFWSAEELVAMDAGRVAAVVGQDPEHPLMEQFAAALRDVGTRIGEEFGGRFRGPVEAAGSVPALAGIFAGWDCFADVSEYDGRQIPFYKRAQLAAADLHRAGVAGLPGFDRLTAFADNLVPHVLRVDGVLRLDPELAGKIEAGALLPHGSSEEVELRACAVHAVELLATATGGALTPADVDGALWNRGRAPRYKSLPRPRSRNTAY